MLFKILHGDSSNISTDITPFHEGWCYVTHDGCFYFDMNIGTEDSPNNQRIKLNAKEAEKITGYDIKTILNSSDIEIPTSKAVLDALSVKADIEDLPIIKDASAGTISLTWDGEIGDKDHFQFGTWTYCKQSDMAPAYSSVTGGYTFRSNGMQNTSKSEGVNCYAFGDAIVVTTAGACSKGGTQFEAPSTGIYFGRMSGWYTEELEMDCDIIYNSLATTDVNGTKHKIAVDENNLLSVTDMSNDSTVYMATTSYVDGKLNETVNPDWNEQDPDSKAYIENRPFYEIPEEKVIISNKQRTMSATSGTSTNSYYINYNNNIIAASTYSFIAEGQQCKLSYALNNGSTVEITGNAKHYSATSGYQYEYYVFGNQYLLNGLTSPSVATNLGSDINSGENTAVIFVLAYYNGVIQTPNCCIYVVTTDIGMQTASLVLSVVNSDVVQLNERFIPDTIARISDISGQISDHNTNESAHSDIRDLVYKVQSEFDVHKDDTIEHITAVERSAWNSKSNFSGNYNDLTNKPIFIATYNTTTHAEIKAAADEGRVCYCIANGVYHLATKVGASSARFMVMLNAYNLSIVTVSSENVWEQRSTPITVSGLDANKVIVSDANGMSVASGVTVEELTFLSGVTSNIQVQIDSVDTNYVKKVTGKDLSTNDYTTDEKNKLAGIASGSEVNQNAFSNITVGSTTIAADSKTDTLTLDAGDNVTITPDATNDKITISSSHPTISNETDTTSTVYSEHGQTFTAIDSITRDSNGHIIKINTKTISLPEAGLHYIDKNSFTVVAGSSSVRRLAARWSVSDVDGITVPKDGMSISLRTPGAGYTGGILLSIDGGTTYYPIVRNVNTLVTTTYASGSTLILVFNSTQTAKPYTEENVASTITGCWQIADYDTDNDTKNTTGSSNKANTKMYIVGAQSQLSSGTTTYSNKNCYIGTDNCLYSNGQKTVVADDIANEINSILNDTTWTETTLPPDTYWRSITYGAGKFVAVTSGDKAAYSTDGVAWTETTIPSAVWNYVTYGNGKFVAVADNSDKAIYSTDGITWTETTMPSETYWNSVAYGSGKFIAVANSEIAAYSTDGITWTETTLPSEIYWSSINYGDGKVIITYGNGMFMVVANGSNRAVYSTDGITWDATTLQSNGSWRSITYGNGKFVIISDSNIAAYSTDGITWTETTIPFYIYWNSVAYGNGKFIAVVGESDIAAYSTDGITWTGTTMPSTASWCSVAYGNGKFIAVTSDSSGKAAVYNTSYVSASSFESEVNRLIEDAISNALRNLTSET